MTSPPPPYSLPPPPAYFSSRKLPPCPPPPRQSSRQTLSNALKRARHAVHLDSSASDIPSAVAAYGEAIELLQYVIARRSRIPGNEAEVERVVDIHDRYADRVRELCHARRLPLPSHIADVPPASRHPLRDSHPDAVESPTSATHSAAYDESEWDTELSSLLLSTTSLSSPSATQSQPSSASSVDSLQWIVSEACDDEVQEWGQYLNGSRDDDDRRASVATSASSAVWSTIAISHG